MSWEQRLAKKQSVAIDGLRFDCISTEDSLSYVNATFSYPYRNGGNIDPMGRDPRRIRMTAVFWQDDYEDALEAFLNKLDTRGVVELIHPIFGMMNVAVASVGVPFTADQPNYCEVPLEFVEDGLDTPMFGAASIFALADDIGSLADLVSAASEGVFAKYLALAKGGLQAMNKAIATMKREAFALAAPVFQTLDLLTQSVDYLAAPVVFIQDMRGAFDARLAAMSGRVKMAEGLPTALVKAVKFGQGKTVHTTPDPAPWAEVRDNLRKAVLPTQYVDTQGVMRSQPAVVSVQIKLVQCLAVVTAASDVLTEQFTLAASTSAAHSANAMTSDSTGSTSTQSNATLTLLSPDDVALLVADARTDIQAAITAWRVQYPNLEEQRPVTEALKQLAVQLEKLGQQVINLRPPLVQRQVTSDCNLRLLAHWWYGDANRSIELLRLNPLVRSPNFVKAGTALRCYAK